MIGLEGSRPDLTDYHECIQIIEDHVRQYTAEQLEESLVRRLVGGEA